MEAKSLEEIEKFAESEMNSEADFYQYVCVK